MPKHIPPFFRYSYALYGKFYLYGRKCHVDLLGVFYETYKITHWRRVFIKERVRDELYAETGGNHEILWEGEEIARASKDELLGLGLWRAAIIKNGKEFYKIDMRLG